MVDTEKEKSKNGEETIRQFRPRWLELLRFPMSRRHLARRSMMRMDEDAKTIRENACISYKETALGKFKPQFKSPSKKFGVPIVLRRKKKREQQLVA
jgi:hypothetical protein